MADNEMEDQRRKREAAEERAQQDTERARLEQERQEQEEARLHREQQKREQRAKEDEERRLRDLASGRRTRELIGQENVDGTNVFRTPQQNAVVAITLLDTLLIGAPENATNILNQAKTLVATSVLVTPGNSQQPSASVRTPYGTRVPPLRSGDYHQPSLSIVNSRSHHGGMGHREQSVHSSADRHREHRDDLERPRPPRQRQPIDLRDLLNCRWVGGDDRR